MKTHPIRFLPLIATALFTSGHAAAALLVYEGFNGYTSGVTLGTGANANPNTNTIGLDRTTAWSGNGVANYTAISTGLTFGSLLTSGGAVGVTATTAVAAAKLSLSSTVTGTIYSSYLVNFTTNGTAAGDGMESRIANDNTTGGARFRAFADSRRSSTNPAVLYSGTDAATSTNATTGLVTGTTYIIISSFTNVGIEATVGSPGVAKIFALTLTQFNSLTASSDWEAYLAAAAVGTGTNQVSAYATNSATSGTAAFATGNFAQFVSVADVATIDELRYGTTLADVLPIPEPGVCLISALGFGLFLRRKRQPRKHGG